jgi:hypothetical protein
MAGTPPKTPSSIVVVTLPVIPSSAITPELLSAHRIEGSQMRMVEKE